MRSMFVARQTHPLLVSFLFFFCLFLALPLAAQNWEHNGPSGLWATVAHGPEWDDNLVFVGTLNEGLYKYERDSQTWSQVDIPLDEDGAAYYNTLPDWNTAAIKQLPERLSSFWGARTSVEWIGSNAAFPDLLLLLSNGNLFRSVDRGESWSVTGPSNIEHISLHAGGATLRITDSQACYYDPVEDEWAGINVTGLDSHVLNYCPTDPDSIWIGGEDGAFESTSAQPDWRWLPCVDETIQIETDEACTDAVWILNSSFFAPWPYFYLYRPSLDSIQSVYFLGSTDDMHFSISPEGDAYYSDYPYWFRFSEESPINPDTLSLDLGTPSAMAARRDASLYDDLDWIGTGDSLMVFASMADVIIQPVDHEGERLPMEGTDNATAWDIELIPDQPDTVFAAGFGGMYRSFDGGDLWERVMSLAVYDVAIGSGDTTRIYAASDRDFWVSQDLGDNWTNLRSTNGFYDQFGGHVAVSPTNNLDVWITTRDGKLYHSINGGTDWVLEKNNLLTRPPLVIDTEVEGRVFVADSGVIHYTDNNGDSWQTFSCPGEVRDMAIVTNSAWRLVVCTDEGILTKSSPAATWIEYVDPEVNWPSDAYGRIQVDPWQANMIWLLGIGKGMYYMHLNNPIIWHPYEIPESELALSLCMGLGGRVYIGTSRHGVWALENRFSVVDPDPVEELLPTSLALANPWPSPFNSTVQLSFILPETGVTTLSVFDIQGRLVEELLSTQMTAGEHQIAWQPKALASGVYLVQLRSGAATALRKVVYVK